MTPRALDLLRRLVAFDTTSSKPNRPLIEAVAAWIEGDGATTRIFDAGEDKASLLAWKGPAPDGSGRGLTLCGHTDVVPALEPSWRTDPFTLSELDGRLYGRGTADMKGFLALALDAFLSVEGDRLRAPLALLFTHDEEVGTLGARFLVEEHGSELARVPRATVIGEPTELRAVRLHKGHLKMRFDIEGESAHSAYPHLGHNAIEPLGTLICAMSEERRRLERDSPSLPSSAYFPEVPFAALNVATVEGGVAVNVVPDHAALELGLRLLPGMEPEQAAADLAGVAARALAGERSSTAVLSTSPPFAADPDSPLLNALRRILGQENRDEAVSFATDAGWLQRLELDCVLWGPGSIRVAHKPNESVPLADLDLAASVLTTLVADFCGTSEHAR